MVSVTENVAVSRVRGLTVAPYSIATAETFWPYV